MIRITVEILPAGAPRRERELAGVIEITNDETDHGEMGNYDIVATRQGRGRRSRARARVERFPRQGRDVWSLLREALGALDREDGIE
jgi:hypothetical protein